MQNLTGCIELHIQDVGGGGGGGQGGYMERLILQCVFPRYKVSFGSIKT